MVTIVSNCRSRGVALAVLYYSQSLVLLVNRHRLIFVDRRTGPEAIPLRHAPLISFSTGRLCHDRRAPNVICAERLQTQFPENDTIASVPVQRLRFFPLHDDGRYIEDTTGIKCIVCRGPLYGKFAVEVENFMIFDELPRATDAFIKALLSAPASSEPVMPPESSAQDS